MPSAPIYFCLVQPIKLLFYLTASLLPLKIVVGIIRGRKLLEVLDTFFWNFRGAGIIRGGTSLEVLRYVKLDNFEIETLFFSPTLESSLLDFAVEAQDVQISTCKFLKVMTAKE